MSDCIRVTAGTTEVIDAAFVDSGGTPKTGLTVAVSIRRSSDGQILQDDLQWVANPTGLPTATAVDATNRPGEYAYAFALPATPDEYNIRCDGGSGAANRYAYAGIKGVVDAEAATCSDITLAALAKFATVDTGETAAVDGSVAKLSQGSPAITIQPVTQGTGGATATKAGVPLWMHQDSAKQFNLSGTDANGVATDYAGRTLRFIVHAKTDPTIARFHIEGAGIVLAPDGKSVLVQATATHSAATLSGDRYVLRDMVSDETLNWGGFDIHPSAVAAP